MENEAIFEETQFVKAQRVFDDDDSVDGGVAASQMRRIKFEANTIKLYLDDTMVLSAPMSQLTVQDANRDIAAVRQMTVDFGTLGVDGWRNKYCKADNGETGKN